MRVCVFHPRMAGRIAEALRAELPSAEVSAVEDISRDPEGAADIEVLVANRFPAGMLGRMPRLRWLQLTGVGTDHVAAGEPAEGLVVSHAGSVPGRAVAEFVWMALLALAKDAPRLSRQQREHVWQLPDARKLFGTRLTVLGTGRIGREVAARARGFDVDVTGVNRSGRADGAFDRVLPASRLEEVLPQSDHVVLCLPSSPSTRNLLDERRLALLPAHAVIVNVARSDVLDRAAVVRALQAKRLRGALLDVHDEEPLPPESPLWEVPGLFVTPHCAYVFPEEEDALVQLCIENLQRFLERRPLLNSTHAK